MISINTHFMFRFSRVSTHFSLLIAFLAILWMGIPKCGIAASGENDSEIFAVATISDINRLLNTISLYAMLEIDVNSGVVLEDKHLISFANYLDYQWVGSGKTAYVYPGKIATFVAEKINGGTKPEEISLLIIKAFQAGEFLLDLAENPAESEDLRMKIGAYLVGEFEYHQEPDGKFLPLMEINQAKFFFSSHYNGNRNNVNAIDFLAEFNPIPEEVIHHIESVIVPHNGHSDTIAYPETTGGMTIPFERLNFTISNIAKSGLNATFGQIRNPFGIWSDFTSHRNFTSTKNNLMVNGFALKKIELGLQLDRNFGPVHLVAALVHGRMGRTSPLFRENADNRFDGIVRATFSRRANRFGVSGYFADLGFRRTAIGVDYATETGRFLLGAEIVYQRNLDFGKLTGSDDVANAASSVAGYLQIDYAISPKLHAYGMYDVWSFYLDGKQLHHPVLHIFHGLRYYVVKNVRWTMVEMGNMDHRQFDRGMLHLSTQVEVTF
jgi:hypothetical protein